jgi:hypothetical protein
MIQDKFKQYAEEFKSWIELLPYEALRSKITAFRESSMYVHLPLIEGKSLSLHQALSCNTPAVCFEAFNQFTRGDIDAIPQGGGITSAYSPEALAESIRQVLQHLPEFKPRSAYLYNYSGRKYFINTVVDSFEYYKNLLPDYQQGKHFQNLWLNLAVTHCYGLSLDEVVYKGIDYKKYSPEYSKTLGRHFNYYRDTFKFVVN